MIPAIPPEGFYTPSNPCETEDLIADVFSNVMGDITQGYQEAISTLAPGSGEPTQGRLASVLSQENVLTNLENGKLFGGLASALGAGLGINASQSGAITSALKSGNYAAALTSLVDFSGSNTAIGGLSTALQSINNGDIVGAFQGLSGPLGIDSKLMGAVGGALGAIKGGDIASLTNALGNLGGAAPQILTDVLGGRLPLSGIDIGGFGAQGGLDFDLALASTFMSTAAAFLECDPPDECPPTDTQTLSSGGESQDESKSNKVNNANIIDKVKATNIPSGDDLKPGSFGISLEGAQEALNNRLDAGGGTFDAAGNFIPPGFENAITTDQIGGVTPTFDTSALTGGIIPESIGGFDTSNLTDGNIIPESVGNFDTSSYLPENSFKVTPKKKFNVPKITKVEVEDPSTTFTSVLTDGPFTTTLTETRIDLGNGNTRVIKSEKTEGGITLNSSGADKKIFWKRRFESGVESFNRTKNPKIKFRLINRINSDGRSNSLYQGTTFKGYDWNALTEEQKNNPNLKLTDVPFFN